MEVQTLSPHLPDRLTVTNVVFEFVITTYANFGDKINSNKRCF